MKKIICLSSIIFLLFLVTGCNKQVYKTVVTNYLQYEEDQMSAKDIPAEGWQEVKTAAYDQEQIVNTLLKQVNKPVLNIVYVHGHCKEGQFSYFGSDLELYLSEQQIKNVNLLSVELSGWSQDHQFDSIKDYVSDILGGANYLNQLAPEVPTVVFGHGLGAYSSLLASSYDKENLIDGVVASSPLTNLMRIIIEGERKGQKTSPPWMRKAVERADEKLSGFFSNYSILKRVDKITIPTLIITGKEEQIPFPNMGLEIYNQLTGDKQFYLLANTDHNNKYCTQSQQLEQIFNQYFSSLINKTELPKSEIEIDYKVKQTAEEYQIRVSVKEERIKDNLAVDLCFKDEPGTNNFTTRKVVFSPARSEVVVDLSFKPTAIYAFKPPVMEINNQSWSYKLTEEERAIKLLTNSDAQTVEDLTEAELKAIDILQRTDKYYYKEWLAESYFLEHQLEDYQRIVETYKSLLAMNLHQNLKLEYFYKVYLLYRNKLNNKAKAMTYYNRLINYDQTKYYVAKAIEVEQNKLDYEDEEYVVKKTVVKGLTKSKGKIVKRQLPYKAGDNWTKEIQQLTEQRLSSLNIVNPLTLKVQAKKIAGKKIKVVITAEDDSKFMIYPVEFGVFRTMNLSSGQFKQRLRNPLGAGWSVSGAVNWTSVPWWEIGLDYTGAGKIYSWNYKDFSSRAKRVNGLEYTEQGSSTKIGVRYLPAVNWSLNHTLQYDRKDYQINKERKQEYLILKNQLRWREYGSLNLGIDYGVSWQDKQPDFKRLTLAYNKESKVNGNKFIYSVQGGLASSDTPLNYQFVGGGYSQIPFRGHSSNLAGDRYLTGSIEYHKAIMDDFLWGIVFIDSGKIVPSASNFKVRPWEVDGGLGLSCDTLLGSLRAEVAVDKFDQKPTYSINLGHIF